METHEQYFIFIVRKYSKRIIEPRIAWIAWIFLGLVKMIRVPSGHNNNRDDSVILNVGLERDYLSYVILSGGTERRIPLKLVKKLVPLAKK